MFSDEATGAVQHAEDPDGIAAALASTYATDLVDVDSPNVAYQQRTVREARFAVSETTVWGSLVAEADRLPFLVVVDVVRGTQTVAADRDRWVRDDTTPFLFPRARKRVAWEDVRLRQTVLQLDAVDRELRSNGAPSLRLLRFASAPVDAARGRHWDDVAAATRRFAASPLFALSPFARTAAFGVLTAAFVEAFAVRGDTPLGEERNTDTGSAAVRRAQEFIAAHADEPIDVAGIADAVDVSVRALQNAFRDHLGVRPLQALRQERIRRAREDLLAAEPGDGTTVGGVAARWGFTNRGRFAAEYTRMHGRSPRADLGHP